MIMTIFSFLFYNRQNQRDNYWVSGTNTDFQGIWSNILKPNKNQRTVLTPFRVQLHLIIIIIIIIIMSLFKEDDIFSTKTNLTYGPLKSKTYLHGYIHGYIYGLKPIHVFFKCSNQQC